MAGRAETVGRGMMGSGNRKNASGTGGEWPANNAAERAVLGAILADPTAIGRVYWLREEEFYSLENGIIFGAARAVTARGDAADLLVVSEELRSTGKLAAAGGVAYIAELTEGLPDPGNIEQYAELVQEAAAQRILIHLGRVMVTRAGQRKKAMEIIESSLGSLMSLAETRARDSDRGEASAALAAVIDAGPALRKAMEAGRGGCRTGLIAIDQVLRPMRAGQLITIAAGTGVGKSSMALQIAMTNALAGASVMVCTLEMEIAELAARLGSQMAGVNAAAIEEDRLTPEEMTAVIAAHDQLAGARLLLDGYPLLSLPALRVRARMRQQTVGLDLLVIDYLQLMLTEKRSDSRAAEVASLSRGLKLLARELSIPIIVVSQLNRKFDDRKEKNRNEIPRLSDLAESSAIEKDSAAVILLDRQVSERIEDSPVVLEETKVIVAKQRFGPTGIRRCRYIPQWTLFRNLVNSPGTFEPRRSPIGSADDE